MNITLIIVKKIAITGATGHLGVNLLSLFQEKYQKEYKIYALYRREQYLPPIKDLAIKEKWNVKFIKVEMSNLESLKSAFKGMDIVIHLASLISIQGDVKGQVSSTNIKGAENLVDACLKSKVKKLIHISSIHAIDHDQYTPLVTEDCPLATNHKFAYNKTKALGQKIIMEAYKKHKLHTVCINPSGILGPYDYRPSLMGSTLLNIYKRKLPSLVKGGFNWVDARDVSQAIINAISKGKPGEFYLITGYWKSFKELAIIIEDIFFTKTRKMVVPIALAMLGIPFFKLWSFLTKTAPLYTHESLITVKEGSQNISYKKAEKQLKYKPRPINKTIKDTINFFKAHQGM